MSSEIGDEHYCICQNFPFKECTRGVWNECLHKPTGRQTEAGGEAGGAITRQPAPSKQDAP